MDLPALLADIAQADGEPARLLDLLHDHLRPMRGKGPARRGPMWRLKPLPDCHQVVHTPVIEWRRKDYGSAVRRERVLKLDMNAGYITAASSATYAHGPLLHTGAEPFDRRRPGYWLIETDTHWNRTDLPNPLGTGRDRWPRRMWLATPMVTLLEDLSEAHLWGGFEVVDSYTSAEPCRLTDWTNAVREMRAAALRAGDDLREESLKRGYAITVQMWLTGKGSDIHRPDWTHTTWAQLASTVYRTMWQCADKGLGPIYMGAKDSIEMTEQTARWAMHTPAPIGSRMLLPYDSTELILGHYKISGVREPKGVKA